MPEDQKKPYVFDWIAGVFTFAIFVLSRFFERGGIPALRWVGVVVLIAALTLAFLPIFTLRKYGQVKKGKSYMDTSVLVDGGIFSIVRHPQYLGYMFFNFGFVLTSQHCVIALLGALAISFFYLHTLDEERFCRKKFGEDYIQYSRKVPRLNLILGVIRLCRGSRARLKSSQNGHHCPPKK
ncbi:MAG: isoprenylcysteine carboxylmethyltransferase family protein [Candidatus Zixiibacteriota bacterium]